MAAAVVLQKNLDHWFFFVTSQTRLTKIKSAAEQEAEAKANGQAIPKSMKKAKADAEEGEDEAAEHSDSESVEDAPQASSKAKRRQAAVEPASGKRDAAGSATKATGSAAADGKKSKTYVYHKAVEAQKLDPEKALALSKMTRKERYEALLDATDSDPDVRTIIISGESRMLCCAELAVRVADFFFGVLGLSL